MTPVVKTIIQITVLHPADETVPLGLDDLAAYVEEGSGIGQSVVLSAEEVPDSLLVSELRALGNDGSFFDE